ncbi:MAG: FeoB-associated Cys-rich membrane protein [Flavisolibacter sp.]
MQNELFIVTLVVLASIAILFFLIRKNRKDRKEVENNLKQDYKKPKNTKSDIESEGLDSI